MAGKELRWRRFFHVGITPFVLKAQMGMAAPNIRRSLSRFLRGRAKIRQRVGERASNRG
jgi:hypothetical protein